MSDVDCDFCDIRRIYRLEGSGIASCTVIEVVVGPKRYARVFDRNPGVVEWGWVLHPKAVLIWGEPEAPDGAG